MRCELTWTGKPDGRQQVDRDSDPPVREVIDPHNFADVISIDSP